MSATPKPSLLELFERYDEEITSIYIANKTTAFQQHRELLVEALKKADAEAPRVEAKLRRLMAFAAVNEERKRQDEQWGGPEHDDEHSVGDWFEFIVRQVEMAYQAPNNDPRDNERFTKIAALAVAAMESLGRKASAAERKGGAV